MYHCTLRHSLCIFCSIHHNFFVHLICPIARSDLITMHGTHYMFITRVLKFTAVQLAFSHCQLQTVRNGCYVPIKYCLLCLFWKKYPQIKIYLDVILNKRTFCIHAIVIIYVHLFEDGMFHSYSTLLKRTFHLSIHENICTIALINIHYLYSNSAYFLSLCSLNGFCQTQKGASKHYIRGSVDSSVGWALAH